MRKQRRTPFTKCNLQHRNAKLPHQALRLAAKEDVQEFYLGMKAQGVRGQRRWKKRKQWR